MSLDAFMHINIYLPLVAFGILMWRTVQAWPAEWAKPNHQWHYRALLVLLDVYVLLTTLGTWAREQANDGGSVISPLLTVQTCVVILVCLYVWPSTKKRGRHR